MKGGVLSTPEVIQCNNEAELESQVTKLIENYNVKLNRFMMKSKDFGPTYVNHFNKELPYKIFKTVDPPVYTGMYQSDEQHRYHR